MFQAMILCSGPSMWKDMGNIRSVCVDFVRDAAVAESQPGMPRNGSLAVQGNAMDLFVVVWV